MTRRSQTGGDHFLRVAAISLVTMVTMAVITRRFHLRRLLNPTVTLLVNPSVLQLTSPQVLSSPVKEINDQKIFLPFE